MAILTELKGVPRNRWLEYDASLCKANGIPRRWYLWLFSVATRRMLSEQGAKAALTRAGYPRGMLGAG